MSAGAFGARLGHVLNACFLVVIVVLLVLLAQRLAGKRAALIAGVAFASVAPTPFLVGWVSGVQDLLGMLFLLAALHFQLSRRTGPALVATALSLLSKETAVVLIPVLASLDWILERQPARLRRQFAPYGLLVVLWACIHPGVQRLVAHGLRSGATGYVGAEHPERWIPHLGRYVLTMLNIPTAAVDSAWIMERLPALTFTLLVVVLGLMAAERAATPAPYDGPLRTKRVLILAGLLSALPLGLTSTMLRGWAPYYAVYPAIGAALFLGVFASRLPAAQVSIVLAGFLVVGFGCRAGKYEPGAPTEYNLSVTSGALRKVETGFKALEGSLPRGAQILVSAQTQGLAAVHTHLYLFQALRVWYKDPTLMTMRPDWRRPAPAQERLFWVSPSEDVFEIDIRTKGARSSGPEPNYVQYQKTLRYYARGLAATGEIGRGLHILLRMPEPDMASWVMDRRLAAMLLIAVGRDHDADSILVRVPPLSRTDAQGVVSVLLGSPAGNLPWDDAAFKAFGIPVNSAEAWRQLMRERTNPLDASDGIRFAQHVLRLVPGDREALATIQRLRRYAEIAPIAMPTPPDSI